MQNHYNLIYREEEREMIPQCIDQGVGVIPWSPLARGVLAGNRARATASGARPAPTTDPFTDYLYSQPTDFDVVERVAEVAAERGVPPAQVALAWLLHKPGVTAPIVGATKLGHLDDALAAEQLDAQRRRDRAPRGALRAAPGARPRLGSLAGLRGARARAEIGGRQRPRRRSTQYQPLRELERVSYVQQLAGLERPPARIGVHRARWR